MEHLKSRPRSATAPLIVLTALGLAAGIIPTIQAASVDAHGMHPMFEQADRDGDGRLSQDEYALLQPATAGDTGESAAAAGMPATEHQGAVIDRFEDRDRDGDGYVTQEEMADRSARD